MQQSIIEILESYNLRNTPCRANVIAYFLKHDFAIAHADLESELKNYFDRVTLYRTLKSFLEKGLIHKVIDNEGSPKYALCNHHHCSSNHHEHNHVHFKCNSCGHTTCLEHIFIPIPSLPKGYSISESNLLITGVCDKCEVV